MEIQKKKRGRPPQNGIRNPEHLARALKIIYAYEKFRKSGMKHSSAVSETVTFVRQLDPETPVSETEVKRVCAELRPSDSPVSLRSSYEILEGEEAAKQRFRLAQLLAGVESDDNLCALVKDPKRPLKRFTISLGKKLNYPRINAKKSNK